MAERPPPIACYWPLTTRHWLLVFSPAEWRGPAPAVQRWLALARPATVTVVTAQMNPRFELQCGSEQAARATIDALSARGLHVVRSFDLQAATAGVDTCGCPYHGTERCTCAYVVLLVYGAGGLPAVVTAHSRADRTFLEIAVDPNALPDRDLVEQVLDTLLANTPPAHVSAPASDAKRLLRDWPAAP